ncbi:MAG: hypothetical protein AAF725_16405, partial [Acidobacteriota bacterium]
MLLLFLALIACHPFVAAYERFQLVADRLSEIGKIQQQAAGEKRALAEAKEKEQEKQKKQEEQETRDEQKKQVADPDKKSGAKSAQENPEEDQTHGFPNTETTFLVRLKRWRKRSKDSSKSASEKAKGWLEAGSAMLMRALYAFLASDRPNARPAVMLACVAGILWVFLPANQPSMIIAEFGYAAGWLLLFTALAYEVFPKPQGVHVFGLLALMVGELWLANHWLHSVAFGFPTDPQGFWASGLIAAALGLFLIAFHKHAAIQKWCQNAALPLGLIRQSVIDEVGRTKDQHGISRTSLTSSFGLVALTLVGSCYAFWAHQLPGGPDLLERFTQPVPSALLLIGVLLPLWVDLFVLCLPPGSVRTRKELANHELTKTAQAILSAARWHVVLGGALISLAGLTLWLQGNAWPVAAFTIQKATVVFAGAWTVYFAGRGLRRVACNLGFAKDREFEKFPSYNSSRWRNWRYRTRQAEYNEPRAELLQAAISGQHSQALVLVFGKAVVLVLIGLLFAYPSLSTLQRGLTPTGGRIEIQPTVPYDAQTNEPSQRDHLNDPVLSLAHTAGRGRNKVDLFAQASVLEPIVPLDSESSLTRDQVKGTNRDSIIEWIAGMLMLTLLVVFLEYEWILRGGQHVRPDRTLKHQTSEVRVAQALDEDTTDRVSRSYHRRLLEQTIFWRIHQAWLPILVIPVNLGFDSLDHRRIVEAMLTGLRDAYRQLYFRWTSPLRLILRGGGILALVWITMCLGDRWFFVADEAREEFDQGSFCWSLAPPSDLYREEKVGPAMQLVCLGGEIAARVAQWQVVRPGDSQLYAENSERLSKEYAGTVFATFFPEISRTGDFSIRLYHLLIFTLLFTFFGWLSKRSPILPYRRTLDEIEMLLAQVSSRQREELRRHPALLPRLVGVFTGEDKIKHWETEPFDPRTIEISVLRILCDIQDPTIHFPYLTQNRVNLPTPEVIFKFDELDKLGIGVLPQHETAGPEIGDSEQLDLERQRSRALHSLFADLKNLVSSGSARFIFIGGRNLHDEWLADQTARRPLLTNIFEVEIYLPSLLVGEGPVDSTAKDLTGGIVAFVEAQLTHARARNQRALSHRFRPWLTPWLENPVKPIFVQGVRDIMGEERLPTFIVREVPMKSADLNPAADRDKSSADADPGEKEPIWELKELPRDWGDPKSPAWKQALTSDFIEFLAYRSRGNVKQLKAALERG